METLAIILIGVIAHLSLANIAYDMILSTINRGARVLADKGFSEEWIADRVAEQRSGLFAVCMFWPITFVTLGGVYYMAWRDTRD